MPEGDRPVPKTKVAITLDAQLLDRVDELVARREFRNRSQAIETALAEKLARARRTRLARECAKLDPEDEKALAEEGLAGSSHSWPEYRGERSVGPTSIPPAAGNRPGPRRPGPPATLCAMSAQAREVPCP